MAETSNYSQGGDAQAISRIAKSCYGSFRKMFDAHGWNVPGGKMMISAPALIVGEYGSIQYWITCPGRDRRTNKRGNLYRPNEELIRIPPTS